MKKYSLIGVLLLFLMVQLHAQSTPQGINYQAIARNSSGEEITNTSITVRFSFGSSGVTNSSFDYQETHAVTTNAFGLFNVVMGQGTPVSGTFSSINWNTQRFLLVEVNFGSGFEQMGSAQPFVSVPYALVAGDVLTKELPASANANDILTWNGSSWVAASPGSVSETTTTLVDNGNGTFTYTNELGVQITFDANIPDGDSDATNELQTLSLTGTNITLSNGGGTVSINDADADPTNEIQDLQLVGNILTITNNGAATPVDLSIYRELPATAVTGQVLTWNGTIWVAQNPGFGADNWGSQVVVSDGTISGDGTAGNPLSGFDGQYSSLSGTPTIPTQTSQLTNDSGFITSPNDADSDPTNEIQNITVSGNAINISGGGTGTTISTNAPASNQVLTWNGTAWVAQNPGSGADNWGTQTVVSDATLTGDGTAGNPLSVVRPLPASATSGQILTWNGTSWVAGNAAVVPTYAAGTGITISGTSPNFTITNSAPDQTVAISGLGATTVTGTYPNFTVSSTDADNQTLSISGNSIAISGGNSINLVSAAPTANQVLTWNGTNWIAATPATAPTYTAGTGISINGSNVISNTAPDQTVVLNNGTGISVTGTYPNFTVTNTAPNQTVAISGSGATTVSGAYPNFTVASTDSDNQNLSVAAGTGASANLNISGGTGVNIAAGTGIGIAVSGTTVTLSNTSAGLPTGTQDQTLRHDGTNWVANSALVNNGANIGIGTTAPQARLHINQLTSGPEPIQIITNQSTSGSAALAFTNSVSSQGYMVGVDNATGIFRISNSSANITSFNRIQIDPSGNVGIGNFVGVISRLDVDGQITMRGGAGTAGYIPVSDAQGTMTWTDPSAVFSGGPWSKVGSTIHPTTSGDFVSIGSTSSTTALSLFGDDALTTLNANSGSPSTAIRLYNNNTTNNNYSSLAFATQLSNGGNSEMAKIVGVNVNHAVASPQGDLAFLTRNSSNLLERMRITGDGDVGIGTVTPGAKLDISGGNTYFRPNGADLSKILVQDNNGTAMRIYTDASAGTPYDLVLGTYPNGHINQLYLRQSNGNIGMGTSNPNLKLQVHATSGAGNLQLTSDATGNANTDGFTISNDGNQAIFMSQLENADWYFGTGGTTAMTISPNAFVGVGTIAPPSKFTAVGPFGNPTIPGNSSTGVARIGVSNIEGMDIGKMGGSPYSMWMQVGYNGSAEPLAIQPLGGNVGIGVTSPTYRFHVENNTTRRTGYFINTLAANNIVGDEIMGVYGRASGTGGSDKVGGYFESFNGTGINYGVRAVALNGSVAMGVYGAASGGSANNWAGYFESGNVYVQNNLGLGTTAPTVRLHVNGVEAVSKSSQNLGNNGVINPNITSYVEITGAGGSYTLSSPSISNGTTVGQILYIASNHGGITTVLNSLTVKLQGGVSYSLGAFDTLTLIWTGAEWLEIGRSNN
jgi:hypothetical protein